MDGLWNSGLDFLCGLTAGWATILSGQPLDFIKTKYQLSNNPTGSLQFARQIFRQYGIFGFYRGASSLFYGFAFTIAIQFAIYEKCKHYFRSYHQCPSYLTNEEVLTLTQISISGSIVGFLVSFIYCPIEYAKITRQINPSIKDSSIKILMNKVLNGEFAKIYRGMGTTLGRQIFGSALYYSAYELTVRKVCELKKVQRRFAEYTDFLLGGSMAGLIYWTVSYPWDVIKTKIQAGQKLELTIKNFPKIAYRGFSTIAVRSVIVNALSFATFEQTKSLASLFRIMTEL